MDCSGVTQIPLWASKSLQQSIQIRVGAVDGQVKAKYNQERSKVAFIALWPTSYTDKQAPHNLQLFRSMFGFKKQERRIHISWVCGYSILLIVNYPQYTMLKCN